MDNQQHQEDPIDSIVLSFSKLLKQLENEPQSDSKSENSSTSSSSASENALLKLMSLHREITDIQESIEKCKLFKEGQELYTKWINLVEQHSGETCQEGNGNLIDDSKSDMDPRTNAVTEKVKDLIALSYNNRGYLKYLQVDFKGALEDYTLALKHNPSLSCAYYNRGLVTYRLAFFEQAVQDMKTAVSLDSSRVEFHEGLEKVSEMLGSPNGHKFRLPYGEADDSKDS